MPRKGNGPTQRAFIKTVEEIESALHSGTQLSHEACLDLLARGEPEDAARSISVRFVEPGHTGRA